MKSDWVLKKISDISRINENTYSTKENWPFVEYLDTGNITENVIHSLQRINPATEKLPSRARRKVTQNSIIYSTVRPNQRHFGIMKNTSDYLLASTGFAVIDVNTLLADADFLYFYLSQPDVVEHLHSIAEQSVSAYPSIKASDIGNLEIRLPPIHVQRNISAILRDLDNKIALNTRINDNLERQLQAVFKTRIINNTSFELMKQASLNDLCTTVTKGTTPTTLGRSFAAQGINFIKAESILDNHSFDANKFSFIDTETNLVLKRSTIQAGDILFTIAGSLGRFALVNEDILPANTNQAVAIIRANREKVLPEYLYTFFLGNWHIDYYTKRVQQAVQANLSLGTIKSLPIPLLPKSAMVEYLALITPIIALIKANESENVKLQGIRDTLLPRLMSGELDMSGLEI